MLAFNNEIEITAETNGTWYIEQLLAKPNVAFRCTHLEALQAGLAGRRRQVPLARWST
jgi:hypothetical protein